MFRTTKQKITIAVALLLLVSDLVLWGATGWNLFTRQQVAVQKVDELLGTTYIEWQNVFTVGLDIAGPVALAVLALSGLLLYLFRARR